MPRLSAAVLCTLLAGVPAAFGQVPPEVLGEPERERPPLPTYRAPTGTPPLVVPTPPPVPERTPAGVPETGRVFVRDIRVVGSTVYDARGLGEITGRYVGRELAIEDLLELRDALTLRYVNDGYVNSGALLPDQEIAAGVVTIQIVEGRLARVDIEGNRWFRASALRARLQRYAGTPLDVDVLRLGLELLQQDSRLARLNAELRPGLVPGEAVLHVRVEEAAPYGLRLEANNHRSPSVGGAQGVIGLSNRNLLGWGDTLGFVYSVTDGLDDFDVSYVAPLNARMTSVLLHYEHGDTLVVESPFDELDIESRTDVYEVALRHPLQRSVGRELAAGLGFEHQRSKTFLLGRQFSFSPGTDDGRSVVSALRFVLEWTDGDARRVIALRSQLSLGVDIFGATNNRSSLPDGQFVAWLGQGQWAHRFGSRDVQVIAGADVQLTPDPLLSIEQFSIGGAESVRGYRENDIVRDNAAVGSLEVRIPLLRETERRPQVELAPFGDVGGGWAARGSTPDPKYLASIGLGLRSKLRDLHFRFYWGYALRDDFVSDEDPQDHGIHLQMFTDLTAPEGLARWLEPWR